MVCIAQAHFEVDIVLVNVLGRSRRGRMGATGGRALRAGRQALKTQTR